MEITNNYNTIQEEKINLTNDIYNMINTIIENKFKPETLKGHLEKWFEEGIITQEDWKCLQKSNELILKKQLNSLVGFNKKKHSNFYNFFYNEEIQDYVKEIYRLFELKV